jgi:hypothetical protein
VDRGPRAPEPAVGTVSPELEAFREAEAKVRDKDLNCDEVAGKMFVLYKNLLSKNTQHKWTTIVDFRVDADMWTDLKGIVHDLAHRPLYQSFKDCVKFHLLSVFPLDAAEQERYYINVHLKKPTRVLIFHFVARLVQLNSYLGTLPGVYDNDSPMAIGKTKKITPFNEADLAQLILKMCPTELQISIACPRVLSRRTCEAYWTRSRSSKRVKMTKSPK